MSSLGFIYVHDSDRDGERFTAFTSTMQQSNLTKGSSAVMFVVKLGDSSPLTAFHDVLFFFTVEVEAGRILHLAYTQQFLVQHDGRLS